MMYPPPLLLLTLQITVNDSILMQKDNAMNDLSDVAADHTLREGTKVMKQLVQTTTCRNTKHNSLLGWLTSCCTTEQDAQYTGHMA